MQVVGHTYQLLEEVNPRTYIGSGKVAEVMRAVADSGAETVIFDDELSPGGVQALLWIEEQAQLCILDAHLLCQASSADLLAGTSSFSLQLYPREHPVSFFFFCNFRPASQFGESAGRACAAL